MAFGQLKLGPGLALGRRRAGGGAAPLAPLAAISGERSSGGIHFGTDNPTTATIAKGVTLPTTATPINQSGDWHSVFVLERGGGSYYSTNEYEMIAHFGTSVSASTASGGMLYCDRNGAVVIVRRTPNNGGGGATIGDFIGGAAGAFTTTTVVLGRNKTYVLAVGQVGNFPVIRAVEIYGDGTVQTWTGGQNKGTGAANFYVGADLLARPAATFDQMWATVGITGSTTNRHGWGGGIGGFVHVNGSVSDANLQALADGSLSLGSLSSLQYWNTMTMPASGVSVAAESVDRNAAAIPITTASTLTTIGSPPVGHRACGPFRTGGAIKLNRLTVPYTFPLVPGRTTGRVWWDGACTATGYPIYGRLLNAADLTELVGWTQIVASHSGSTFAGYVDGVGHASRFYREVWVGPSTSTIGGSDGHIFSERVVCALGVVGLSLGQSQKQRQATQDSGLTLAPSVPANTWWTVRGGFGGASSAPFTGSAPGTTPPGPREISAIGTGIGIGDGIIAMLNRLGAETGYCVDMMWAPRSGHSIIPFCYDRVTTSKAASGSGTTRTATLTHPGVSADTVGIYSGVEPGSMVITTANLGTFTDADNASMTGSQLTSANTQNIPAQTGLTGTNTINYYTGALTMNFTSDPGVTTISWKTRYDTQDGSSNAETTPDKFTLFGDSATNGHVRRLFGISPYHGFSFVEWDGATSSTSTMTANTASGYTTVKAQYEGWVDALTSRIWSELDPRAVKPVLLMGEYGRSVGANTGDYNLRRLQRELSFEKLYVPANANDGSTNATLSAYRWHRGAALDYSLDSNGGEHQDAQTKGGMRFGETDGHAMAALMLGDASRHRGPEWVSAVRKSGSLNTIEVTPTFYRTGATALAVDIARSPIPAGDTANLKGWRVKICAGATPTDSEIWTFSGYETITASLNSGTGKVELLRASLADWPNPATQALLIYYKHVDPFLDSGGGSGNRTADETDMASNLYDNAGGWTYRPGAEAAPLFAFPVTP